MSNEMQNARELCTYVLRCIFQSMQEVTILENCIIYLGFVLVHCVLFTEFLY
jgi:hypothetical protein